MKEGGGWGGHGEGKPQRTRRKTSHGGHSAAGPQPNRRGGCGLTGNSLPWRHENLRARRRFQGLAVQRKAEGTEKENHSAAEPQPNRCGGIKNPRARKRIYGLVVHAFSETALRKRGPFGAAENRRTQIDKTLSIWAPQWHRDRKRGADTLVRPYKARHWVARRAVGKGGQGRLESGPQARKPAPQMQRAPQERRAPLCGGGLRWTAQPWGPDGVGTPAQLGIV